MRQVGLIGSGIGYSLSPVIHNSAFAALELDWGYSLLDIRQSELEETLYRLRSDPWMGANVTIPFKQEVMPFLDRISPEARLIGAVNTIVRRGTQLLGENTDMSGFRQHLHQLGWLAGSQSAVIFGAGGAARAAALALLLEDLSVTMIARSPSRADAFQNALAPALRARLSFLPWCAESTHKAAAPAQIVVNATPLGGFKMPDQNPWPPSLKPLPDMRFYDMTYNPALTPFLRLGQASGLHTSSGLGMLIRQGAEAFRIWTGMEPDTELMYTAAVQSLEEHHAAISDSR